METTRTPPLVLPPHSHVSVGDCEEKHVCLGAFVSCGEEEMMTKFPKSVCADKGWGKWTTMQGSAAHDLDSFPHTSAASLVHAHLATKVLLNGGHL